MNERDMPKTPKPICRVCGRAVAKMPRHGKRHYPHNCEHGVPCVTGDHRNFNANHHPLAGPHFCQQCHDARQARTRTIGSALMAAFRF